ncbi:DUF3558 domain-containing protein [Gordonia pseudamarae]|jgi:hypothetical protein|uniref:DUF3558 domain-containing protein n=1 Tax=Gordonia pseudamarae TaxID=2831662 RepID=A0ABX6IGL9_9ACTN|nr:MULTISPECIES: DUF3558 domain-containing protein [Gordonia]MBD0023463.1 DUF3558 domain-containing protein [Gordonia sp. (in: high G+C Gram-positive bacteria)]QHN25508.1 DUF3558 domain-containing protein [Gordonia pseudamarae]QHN34438.1 DUF3558 domain-containing protein [Gordonia pseudamarae]
MTTRFVPAVTALLAAMLLLAGCSVDGEPVAVGQRDTGGDSQVDTDRYDNLLLECDILSDATISKVLGGGSVQGTFVGAICRWIVTGATTTSVTFTWYESGSLNSEKQIAKKFGYTTENIKIASQTGFTQRDPKDPGKCGVTARAPSRGVFTWWTEPRGGAAADPCAAPTKLMELVLSGGQ